MFCQDWSLPRSHAMQAILDFAGQKTHVLRGRLPPAFFSRKYNPQILDMLTRPIFQRLYSFSRKKIPKCSGAAFFAVISDEIIWVDKTHVLRGRLPPAFFFPRKNATPKCWTCRTGQLFNDVLYLCDRKMTKMFRGLIFCGNFG